MQITKTRNSINNKWIIRLVQIVTAITIFSQIGELEAIFRPLMYGSWIFLLVFSIVYQKGSLHFSKLTLVFANGNCGDFFKKQEIIQTQFF